MGQFQFFSGQKPIYTQRWSLSHTEDNDMKASVYWEKLGKTSSYFVMLTWWNEGYEWASRDNQIHAKCFWFEVDALFTWQLRDIRMMTIWWFPGSGNPTQRKFPPLIFLTRATKRLCSSRERKWRFTLYKKNSRVFLIFLNFWRLRAAVSLWVLHIVWKSFSIPFERAMMQQRSPHSSWVISDFHVRKRLKFAKSNGPVSAAEFMRHTLTPTINFGEIECYLYLQWMRKVFNY